MGKRGRPPKVKEEEVQEEVVKVKEPITEPKTEEKDTIEENPETEENENGNGNPETEETSDFNLDKENQYLVAGFKASKHYTDDKNNVEMNFKKYLETGE